MIRCLTVKSEVEVKKGPREYVPMEDMNGYLRVANWTPLPREGYNPVKSIAVVVGGNIAGWVAVKTTRCDYGNRSVEVLVVRDIFLCEDYNVSILNDIFINMYRGLQNDQYIGFDGRYMICPAKNYFDLPRVKDSNLYLITNDIIFLYLCRWFDKYKKKKKTRIILDYYKRLVEYYKIKA